MLFEIDFTRALNEFKSKIFRFLLFFSQVEIDAILALNRDLNQKMGPPPQVMNNHMLASSKARVRISEIVKIYLHQIASAISGKIFVELIVDRIFLVKRNDHFLTFYQVLIITFIKV